jgi:hypothetical protein
MSTLVRALLLSAAATGVAAVVMKAVLPSEPSRPRRASPPPADPDALTPEEEQMLVQELAAQV